jgi:hypothetical protein
MSDDGGVFLLDFHAKDDWLQPLQNSLEAIYLTINIL